jgi:hypothetical protein
MGFSSRLPSVFRNANDSIKSICIPKGTNPRWNYAFMSVNEGTIRPKFCIRFPCSTTVRYGIHTNCLENVARAIYERVFFVKDQEHPGKFKQVPGFRPAANEYLLQFFRRFRKHRPHVSAPITHDEFVGMYEGSKRRVYENAVASLAVLPLHFGDSKIKAFPKIEKTNFTAKPDPPVRLISPRTPRFNVSVGIYIKPLEKQIFHTMTKIFGYPVIAKGLNFQQRAAQLHKKWMKKRDPRALPLDCMRFDQHTNTTMLTFEFACYSRCFPRSTGLWLFKFLTEHCLDTYGIVYCDDGTFRYKKTGIRCSGDMFTSLGNILLMCAMLYTLVKRPELVSIDNILIDDDGDDAVPIMEAAVVDRFMDVAPAHFLSFGYELEVGPAVATFEKISYCQTQPVHDGLVWTMVRDPRVALAKDSVCLLPLDTTKQRKAWIAAVAACGERIAGGIPVWNSFYKHLRRIANGVSADERLAHFSQSGMYRNSIGMKRQFSDPTPDSRVSFAKAFGISPEMQVGLESYYDQLWYDVDKIQQVPFKPQDFEFPCYSGPQWL